MEMIQLIADKRLYCITATAFPEGITAAFDRLQQLSGNTTFKDLFGISRMGPEGIVYKAAAQETYEGEGVKKGCEIFVLKKGRYYGQVIKDWQQHMEQFHTVFAQLLQHPDLDPEGYCAEWYKGVDEVICMVKLMDKA